MNLFLLAAVPLAAVACHRLLQPSRRAFADPKGWILGAVWSVLALVVASFFAKARIFSGDLGWTFLGLAWTDAILVPGGVAAAWILTRDRKNPWELALWLALAFTLAGIRDFAGSTRSYDLTEYFLIPLDRILLILTLPPTVVRALEATSVARRTLWWSAAGLLVLTGAAFPVLSFAHLGWLVWVLVIPGIAASVWWGPRISWEAR